MKAARWIRRLVPAVILVATGCPEPEPVRVHDEPKPAHSPVASIPAEQKKFRTLAAMFPRDDEEALKQKDPNGSWWFFKLSGPADVVGKSEADFFKLIDSVRFTDGGDMPITWESPAGWTKEAGGKARYATLKGPDGKPEVAVSTAGGVVLMNVQRWWGQLWGKEKGEDVSAINLNDYTRQRTVNGRLVLIADLAGPKDPNMKDPNMGTPGMNPHNPHGGSEK